MENMILYCILFTLFINMILRINYYLFFSFINDEVLIILYIYYYLYCYINEYWNFNSLFYNLIILLFPYF